LTNTASVWGSQLGYDTLTIVVKEFWPDIHRKLSHKRKDSNVAQLALISQQKNKKAVISWHNSYSE